MLNITGADTLIEKLKPHNKSTKGASAKSSETEPEITDSNKKLEIISKENTKLKVKLTKLAAAHELEIQKLREQFEKNDLKTENASLQEMVNQLLQGKTEFENRMFEMRVTEESLRKQNEGLNEMIRNLLEEKEKNEFAVAEATASVEKAEKDKKVTKELNTKLKDGMKMMQREINRLKELVAAKEDAANDEENSVLRKEHEELKSQLDELKEKLTETQKSLTETRETLSNQEEQHTKHINELELMNQKLRSENEALMTKANSVTEKQDIDTPVVINEDVERELSDLREKLDSISLEKDSLEEKVRVIESEKEKLLEQFRAAESEKTNLLNQCKSATQELATYKESVKQMSADQSTSAFQIEQMKSTIAELKSKNTQMYQIMEENEKEKEKAVTKAQDLTDESKAMRSRIQSLTEELANYNSAVEKITNLEAQLTDRVHQIDTLTETMQDYELLKEQLKEKEMVESQLQEMSQEMNVLKEHNAQIPGLIEKAKELERAKKEIKDTKKNLDQTSAQLKTKADELCDMKVHFEMQEKKLQEETEKAIRFSIEKDSLQSMIEQGKMAVDKNEKTIVKLKTLLQRSVDSNARKDQQIETLQGEIKTYIDMLNNGTSEKNSGLMETVVKLEYENKELEKRLSEAQPSAELQSKNERLAKMLEKSHTLYSQLSSENKELRERLSRRNSSRTLKMQNCTNITVEPTRDAQIRENKEKKRDEVLLVNTYLKSSLIQFFAQDSQGRANLIPLILELVGCNEQQIRAARRQWARSNQFIQKAGIFGI